MTDAGSGRSGNEERHRTQIGHQRPFRSPGRRDPAHFAKRRFWLLLAAIALLWLVYGSPWRGSFAPAALAGQLEGLGNWAIAWFVAVYVLLTVAGGLAFGFAWGVVLVSVVAL